MAKRIFYDDIMVSEIIGSKTEPWKANKVVGLIQKVEQSQARDITKTLKRILPSKYYISVIAPNVYSIGSIYHTK